MRTRRVLSSILAAAALSLSGAACSSESDKSGGDAAQTKTLKLATPETRGAPYADSVLEFARQVKQLSDGSLRVQIIWDGAVQFLGEYGPRADQDMAGLVQSGKLASALIPARAWDELGVTSLQALQAPFLVSTEELVEQIVQGEPAEEMLAGLDKAGVVGLTLLPEGLRHPAGFARPLLTPEDFAGARIRVPLSNASYRLMKALAAKPIDVSGDEFTQAVADGEIDGAESGFAWGVDNLPQPNTFTANVTFYPKVNAIVVNKDTFGNLSDEHREILREAAAKTLSHTLKNAPSEQERAKVYCANGGRIAFASDADVAGLERAAEPVYAALEADPQTKELIAQFRRMRAESSSARVPVPEGCAARSETPPITTVSAPSEFPEGVYRVERSAQYLIGKGMDPQKAYGLAGIVTLTFENGRWRDHGEGAEEDCVGVYSVKAGRISLRQDRDECGEPAGTLVMSARWKLEDGKLRFFDVQRGHPLEWGSKPWTKID